MKNQNPKDAYRQKVAKGPHWVCYRCDAMVESAMHDCPHCRQNDMIDRCNRSCVRCAEERLAAAEAVLSELVTKADLHVAMADLKADLIKVQIGSMVAMTAIYGGLVAALKLFA